MIFSFFSYGLWLTSQIIESVYTSESIDISQSISINQFDAIEASNLIGGFFCFPIIQHNLIFSTHAGRAGHLNK